MGKRLAAIGSAHQGSRTNFFIGGDFIFFDQNHIGGYQELRTLEKSGKLKENIK